MGYPITSKTTLSIAKTAKLLQKLVDLTEEKGGGQELPEDIQECVTEVLDAQEKFVKQIDKYLHSKERVIDEFEVVSSIIETCPEFLATKDDSDEDEDIPIRWFACSDNEEAVVKYVPLLAEVGRKYGVGGEEDRGGLLVKNARGGTALSALLTRQKSSNVMEALRNADPPLLLKEDVRDYSLLNGAAAAKSLEMVKFMSKLDPSCLYYEHDRFGIPLLQACFCKTNDNEMGEERKITRLRIMKYLIREAVLYDAFNNTIGGLFFKTRRGTLILDLMVRKYGADDTWSCIKQALSSFPSIPILHEIIRHSPQNIGNAITQFPDSILIRNSQNRLPIHVALECGMEWGQDLVLIMHVNRYHWKDFDPVTKQPPFLLAALDKTRPCDLSTIYYLLRGNPQHVEVLVEITN